MSRGATPRLATSRRSVAMLSWEGYDGTMQPRTGQKFHFERDLDAWSLDAAGNLYRIAADQPRPFYHAPADRYGLISERGQEGGNARKNLCLRSQALANWTASNLAVTDNSVTRGLLQLALLNDTSGSLEGRVERTDVNLLGSVAIYASLFVVAGTATQSQIILKQSGGTTVLDVTISWSGGVPSPSATTGTVLLTVNHGNGLYRLYLKCAGTPASGNATIQIIPAKTAASTGTLYAGGVQVELVGVSSYIITGAATVLASPDNGYWDFLPTPRAMTVYTEFLSFGACETAAGAIIVTGGVRSGDSPNNNGFDCFTIYWPGSTGLRGSMNHASLNEQTAQVSGAIVYGTRVEARLVLDGAGGLTFGTSLNGATEGTATASGVVLPSAWSHPRLNAGQHSAQMSGGGFLLTVVRVFPGVLSMADCRKLR